MLTEYWLVYIGRETPFNLTITPKLLILSEAYLRA